MTLQIEDKIINAIVELLDLDDGNAISPSSRIEDDLGIDSGLLLELFLLLEEQVPNLRFDPAELRPEQFETVRSFADLIASCVNTEVPA